MNDGSNLGVPPSEPTRGQVIFGVAMVFAASAVVSTEVWAGAAGEIAHVAESIHQEVVFKATRKRVYEALSDAKQFDRVVQLSDAKKTRMPAGAPPTQISHEVGGAFSTFGGLIVATQIELVPNTRIVQECRPAYWEPGGYSM